MEKLFRPVASLMGRLRYPYKFGLIFAIILVPLVLFASMLISSELKKVAFFEKEHHGIIYIKAIRPLFTHMPQHRGMTRGLLNGDESFRKRILAKRKDVDAALASTWRPNCPLKATSASNAVFKAENKACELLWIRSASTARRFLCSPPKPCLAAAPAPRPRA